MSLYRAGNYTQQMIEDSLGPIMTALMLKKVLFIVGLVLGIFLICLGIGLFIYRRRLIKIHD